MLDLASTRLTTGEDLAGYYRLLAAVVAQAVSDASRSLTAEEKERRMNLDGDAHHAINWFFDKSSSFEAYSKLIGFSAEGFRKALISPTPEAIDEQKRFTSTQRRIVRIRHEFYRAAHEL